MAVVAREEGEGRVVVVLCEEVALWGEEGFCGGCGGERAFDPADVVCERVHHALDDDLHLPMNNPPPNEFNVLGPLPSSPLPSSIPDKPKKPNPLSDLIDTEQVYVDLLAGIIRVSFPSPLVPSILLSQYRKSPPPGPDRASHLPNSTSCFVA